MLNLYRLCWFVLTTVILFTAVPIPGHAQEVVDGTLTVLGSSPFLLKDRDGDPVSFTARSVSARFTVDKKPMMFSTNFNLKSIGSEFTFKIKKKDFTGEMSLSSPASSNGQGFDLAVLSNRKLVREWEQMGYASCSYSGNCTHATTNGPRYGHYSDCKGRKDAVWHFKTYRTQYIALFSPALGGPAVAKFSGYGPEQTESAVVRALSRCNQATGLTGMVGKVIEYPLESGTHDTPQSNQQLKKQLEEAPVPAEQEKPRGSAPATLDY